MPTISAHSVGNVQANFEKIIGRSRSVANGMSKGIQFLIGKNKITTIMGTAKLTAANKISVTDSEGKNTDYTANHIVLATGARSRSLPNLQQDSIK